jgi:hypothetical protein
MRLSKAISVLCLSAVLVAHGQNHHQEEEEEEEEEDIQQRLLLLRGGKVVEDDNEFVENRYLQFSILSSSDETEKPTEENCRPKPIGWPWNKKCGANDTTCLKAFSRPTAPVKTTTCKKFKTGGSVSGFWKSS